MYKLLHVILVISLISCGNYSEFLSQSDLKASRSDKATIEAPVQEAELNHEDSNKPKESDLPPPGDEIDENLLATRPLIISGSYLSCFIDRSGEFNLMCRGDSQESASIYRQLKEKSELIVSIDDKKTTLLIRNIISDKKIFKILFSMDVSFVDYLFRDLNSKGEIIAISDAEKNESQDSDTKSGSDTAMTDPVKATEEDSETLDPPPVAKELQAVGENLIVNGSFESDVPNLIWDGGRYGFFSNLTGWERTTDANIEVQRNISRYSAAEGEQWIELCSTDDSGVSQNISTEVGSKYRLSYSFSPRPGYSESRNHLRVQVDGNTVAIHKKDGTGLTDVEWTDHSVEFTANNTESIITLESGSCSGAADGTYLDNVILKVLR